MAPNWIAQQVIRKWGRPCHRLLYGGRSTSEHATKKAEILSICFFLHRPN